ncbi:hypothetical protein [Paenarthrobacter nitroguajacolicus]|uniref:hypothetical protein n=1 Tax=Paenarthrobacter nitroguajacolicus TaxID=211146 RepID=UPI00248B485A|nr:hypothetical protein [Paenarthrobacter nitroguajacolicus]MDI2036850.1 hypothetical protein [Paenarthrobacter nitroguajacolicus]
MDQLWTRVWDPAEEDLTHHRIYAGGPSSDEATYVSDREDLEPLFIDQWHSHIAPDLHLHTISTLGEQLKKIEAQLNDAVAAVVRVTLGFFFSSSLPYGRSRFCLKHIDLLADAGPAVSPPVSDRHCDRCRCGGLGAG